MKSEAAKQGDEKIKNKHHMEKRYLSWEKKGGTATKLGKK